MKLAESSARKLEEFFREYLNDEEFVLPPIFFYTGRVSKLITHALKIHGITIGARIFILPELVSLNSKNKPSLPESLVAHEIAHVLQYKREGFFKFLYKYLRDYRRNLKKESQLDFASRHRAYLNIPFEIEARETAENFCNRNEI